MEHRAGNTVVPDPRQRSLAVGVSTALCALLVALAGIWAESEIAVLVGAAIGLVAMVLLPRNALPAAALWILVLIPVGYMDIGRAIGRFFTPAVLIIALWMIRVASAQRMTLLMRLPVRGWVVIAPVIALLLTSTLMSDLHPGWSLAWMAVFVICIVAPAVTGQISQDDVWPTVRWAFAAIGLFLGALAVADFLFEFNPWSVLYRYDVSMRTWAVFRTQTSLGHPLMTSTVGCVSVAVCVFPYGTKRQWPYWICACAALVAVLLAVSRTSVPAMGAGLIGGALALLANSNQSGRRRQGRLTSLLIAAGLAAAVALSPMLSARNVSSGGVSSANYRQLLFDRAADLVTARPLLGSGPGTSSLAYIQEYGGILENSYIQIMVSIGLPAALLLLIGLGAVVLIAIRRGRAGVAAGLVSFLVSVAGFNALDSNPAVMALIAPLIFCAVAPKRPLQNVDEISDVNQPATPRASTLGP